MREVAVQIVGRRHRVGEGVQVRFAELLIGEEEEALIFAVVYFGNTDLTAQGATEIVAAVTGPQLGTIATQGAAADAERLAGIQVFVDEVLESSTVILIGAGLHGHV